jgi:hypothetical protein
MQTGNGQFDMIGVKFDKATRRISSGCLGIVRIQLNAQMRVASRKDNLSLLGQVPPIATTGSNLMKLRTFMIDFVQLHGRLILSRSASVSRHVQTFVGIELVLIIVAVNVDLRPRVWTKVGIIQLEIVVSRRLVATHEWQGSIVAVLRWRVGGSGCIRGGFFGNGR